MRSYSMDLRERILKDSDAGMPTKLVSEKYSVSPAWVRRLKQRRRETGETTPRPPAHRPATWTSHADAIRQLIEAEIDITLVEIKEKLQLELGLTTIWRAVQALRLTVKKNDARRRTTSPRRRRKTSELESGSTQL